MATLHVQPRGARGERTGTAVDVHVDDDLVDDASAIEDWVTPRAGWELVLREGYDTGRANNVEAVLLYVDGNQTSSLSFRLDQLETVRADLDELVLDFEEESGFSKWARCTANGLDVELFHVLGALS
jgi:hypothetical protein